MGIGPYKVMCKFAAACRAEQSPAPTESVHNDYGTLKFATFESSQSASLTALLVPKESL